MSWEKCWVTSTKELPSLSLTKIISEPLLEEWPLFFQNIPPYSELLMMMMMMMMKIMKMMVENADLHQAFFEVGAQWYLSKYIRNIRKITKNKLALLFLLLFAKTTLKSCFRQFYKLLPIITFITACAVSYNLCLPQSCSTSEIYLASYLISIKLAVENRGIMI